MKKIINKDSCLLYCAIYTITTILNSILYLCQGLKETLAKSTYKDIFINYTLLFILVVGIDLVVKKIKNRKR